jgi:ribosomal protein S18 acetylase RimI-like enzyme
MGRGDLPALLAFASDSFFARAPLGANWHPGDVVWELRGQLDTPQPIRMWTDDQGVIAVGWFVDQGRLWLEALPHAEVIVPEIVHWAEQSALRRSGADGVVELSIRAFDRDADRIRALAALGYARGQPEGVQFEVDLAQPIGDVAAPAGFVVRDSSSIDPERRAAAHRDAWNDLSRIGLPDARSTFDAATYEDIREGPIHDPSLDLVVETAAGQLVASCIVWADDKSGIGIFEPVGVHRDFRGRRLASMMIGEGLRRLRVRGHRTARIGTAHFNAPAIAAYGSAYFHPRDRTWWWTKSLS